MIVYSKSIRVKARGVKHVVRSITRRIRVCDGTSLGSACLAPPTVIEQALLEAKTREDWPAYFETLAREPLYHEIQRDKTDADPSRTFSVFGYDPRVGGSWYQDMVEAHQILVSDPGSPWLNIPFRS